MGKQPKVHYTWVSTQYFFSAFALFNQIFKYSFTHQQLLLFDKFYKFFILKILIFCIVANRPIEDWNTSEIVDMSYIFLGKTTCNPNLAKWDVSNVTDFVSVLE
jgi:hypothetical protein